jgi:hypothetical protein
MPILSAVSSPARGAFKFKNRILAQVLLVGGGGSGGAGTGGGGGAGGLIDISEYEFFPGAYTVSIGAGGTNDDIATGTNGVSTSITNSTRTLTALGGGFGAASETGGATYPPGTGGGSGGGAQGYYSGNNNAGLANQPANTSDGVDTYDGTGYGNNGGNRSGQQSGGGGGAGAVGSSPGNGGGGYQSSITGTAQYYAAGGGGAQGGTTSVNGIGGRHVAPNGTNGVANTGSGGGGGWNHAGGTGGNGGSGVAIIRFRGTTPTVSAGLTYTETTDGDYTVLKFTNGTGTITWL